MKLFGYEIKRSLPTNAQPCECYDPQDALLFGKLFSDNGAMNLSTVYRCVDLISDSVAMLPIRVMNVDSNNCKSVNRKHSLNLIFKNGIASQLSKYQFIKLLIQSVILNGNGYAYIERANDGTVIALRYLESGDVQIHYDPRKPNSLFYTCNHFTKKIEPCNMIHLRKYSKDGVNGRSVLHNASRSIKVANAGENHAKNTLENGCNLTGVLKVEGSLTKDQRQSIRNTWTQTMAEGGSGIAVIQGNMDYQSVQINPSDAQLLETRAFEVVEICRWFGVSPILLGDLTHTQYGSLEAAQQEFLLHTLSGYIAMCEEEFTKKLFKPSEDNMEINMDETAILRTDKTALANYYQTMLKNGVYCVNEARRELGLQEIEGGDQHIIPYTNISQNTINNVGDNNSVGGADSDSNSTNGENGNQ